MLKTHKIALTDQGGFVLIDTRKWDTKGEVYSTDFTCPRCGGNTIVIGRVLFCVNNDCSFHKDVLICKPKQS